VNISFEISIVERGKKSPKWRATDPETDRKMTIQELLETVKKTLQTVAVTALREEQARGFTKFPVITIDKTPGKNISDVSPLGQIMFSEVATDSKMLLNIYADILRRSPVGSGVYRKSNIVTLNGEYLAGDYSQLEKAIQTLTLKPGDIIRYINIAPYARRLEALGVTAQKARPVYRKSTDKKKRSGSMVLKETGVYFMTSRSIKKRLMGSSIVRFQLMPGHTLGINSIPVIANGRVLRKFYKGHVAGEKPGSNFRKGQVGSYLYPTIVVVIREGTET
jgi:hypothetical protein